MGARAERAAAGIVTKQKTAPLPAPFLVHLRVESAHFDWRWRERPALALLAWEAMARDPLERLRRMQVESIGTTINLGPDESRGRPGWSRTSHFPFALSLNRLLLDLATTIFNR
jgi:hypothetical protein